jgi:hypothetical protein
MGAKTGLDCKLYYREGGVDSGDSWHEATNVRDLTLGGEKGEADVSTRASRFRLTLGTLKDFPVEFQQVWDPDDEFFGILRDAFQDDAIIGLAIMDGDIATGEGLVADFVVTKFARNEPLEEAVTADVTVKPTYSSRLPFWVENGTPTATAT